MSNQVYANNMEVSCKAAAGKSICAMPDVCMTPPQTPATPPGVPIPYPNTGMASDCTDGSSTVSISGQEIMLKNKSYFKKSTGDEAGSAPMKGVVTGKNTGAVYFTMWSMDVQAEGENVVRHMDMTTHNHGSDPPNTVPWLYADAMALSKIPDECKEDAKNFKQKCGGCVQTHPDKSMNMAGTNEAMCKKKGCKEARECVVTPYNLGCCDGKTPHHIVPKSQFKLRGASTYTLPPTASYDPNTAPCICESGISHSTPGRHGDIHTETNNLTVNHPSVVGAVSETGKSIDASARWSVAEAEQVGAEATAEVTKCKAKCIQDQVRKGHENLGVKPNDQIRPTTAGRVTQPGGQSAGYP